MATAARENLLVACALGRLGEPFLGPQLSFASVGSDRDAKLVGTAVALLDSLHIEHPAGLLLRDLVASQDRHCGTSSTLLLVLVGLLADQLTPLLEQGIPEAAIAEVLDETLEIVLSQLGRLATEPPSPPTQPAAPMHKRLSTGASTLAELDSMTSQVLSRLALPQSSSLGSRFLSYSRHSLESPESVPKRFQISGSVAERLAHGRRTAMRLARVVERLRAPGEEDVGAHTLLSHRLQMLHLCGPVEEHSCSFENTVLLPRPASFDMFHGGAINKIVKCILLHGDITPTAMHLGFKAPQEKALSRPSQVAWQERQKNLILQLVGKPGNAAVVTRGLVHRNLCSELLSHGVLVLSDVEVLQLKGLELITKTRSKATLDDCRPEDVVELQLQALDHPSPQADRWITATAPDAPRPGAVVDSTLLDWASMLLCSPCPELLEQLEIDLRRCCQRLRHTLSTRKCLPGGGATELALAATLEAPAQITAIQHRVPHLVDFVDAICNSLARAFRAVSAVLNRNMGENVFEALSSSNKATSNHGSEPLDDLVAKSAAIERAFYAAKLLMSTAFYIVN
eukprot:m.8590 g.8590  ORF g.8590 m.8590 type:complete len:569 (-) comp2873_c0_seq1:76-1782(-)